jgi:glycosyltransferase involved in cell wall biosynthesis
MIKKTNFEISIVIPVLNAEKWLPTLFKKIEAQSLLPKEIIIVDSSPTNRTAEVISDWIGTIPIHFQRVDFAYPGRARNIGVKAAQCKWIAFIDSRIFPEIDWLEKCCRSASENNAEIVIASRSCEADTNFKRVLRAATYGFVVHKSLAGSLLLKDTFEQSGGFVPDIRSGEDIEWMQKIASLGVRIAYITDPVVRYHGLPENLIAAIMKWSEYAVSKVNHEIKNNQKKLYFLILIFVSVSLIHNWNAIFAQWDQSSIYYVANITKMLMAAFSLGYFFYRGIIRPLQMKVKLSYLLPGRWLQIIFVGLCLDIAKAPGLIWGALLLMRRRVAGLQDYLRTHRRTEL